MKSFSSTSFASSEAESLRLAEAAVARHPQALFTDFQWFLYEAQDTVFFTAYSKNVFDKAALTNLVADMVSLAPQLTHGFVGARPGQPFPQHLLDAITSIETVEDFEGYPDKWITRSADIFERDDLPLFRVMVINRAGGADAEGRASLIQVRSSHALLEGSDSALLTRSQSAGHGVMSDKSNKVSLGARIQSNFRAWLMASMYLFIAHVLAPGEKPFGFKTLALKRHRLRVLANRLGVRQRSLYFALVTFALNGAGPEKQMSRKVIGAAYTMLDTKRNDADDDFFRVRALEAKFPVHEDFVDFVRAVDDTVARIEQKDITRFQVMINAMFRTLRGISRVAPFLLTRRFWRFNGKAHVVLTLVPPHRTYGPMTHGVIEPIYCGAYHPGSNLCTFCPGREYVTLNFSMETRHLDNVHRIEELLAEIEARDLPPPPARAVEGAEAA
ncbi:hypothetical protein EMQ25_00700 [Arsenicitalea aurantiaca]|uniref:Uncharacterized protein n=1 Tax=Arsenicitalea aurantiaca TaxID=1783274 RepID=A0A433XKA9_9HYPH|nr:hypothetical protein [Arsenicitalea aurantiaca]RUT34517.1 hypothetical protein EMQ25_00700 [Arsenicitalea aurantiaca]